MTHRFLSKGAFAAAVCGAWIGSIGSATAQTTATYTFLVGQGTSTSTPNADVGSNLWSITQSVLSHNYTLSLAGFDASGAAHNLFTKDGGAGEQGVGLTGVNDNELGLDGNNKIANFIRYDVSSIYTAFGGSTGQIKVESIQSGEGALIWGSNDPNFNPANTTANPVLTLGSTADSTWVNLPSWGNYKYYFASSNPSQTAGGANVVVNAIDVVNITTVPEAGTNAAIVAAAGIGLVTWVRRKKKG